MALSLPRFASRMNETDLAVWHGSFAPDARPVGIAQPHSADDVVEIMRWAAQKKVPVAPFSSLPDPHPRRTQVRVPSLFMDMSGMNRIAQIDRRDRVAMVEAGVTFEALDAALAPHGLRSFRPLRPRPGKSALASYLDREPIMKAVDQWDVLDPIGGGEIVFGSGETFRTGSASGPWPKEDMWKAGVRFLTAIGPVVTDFMRVVQGSQGTLGVVPWAAVLCDVLPPLSRSFIAGSDTPDPLVALCIRMMRRRMGGATFIANRNQLASLLGVSGDGLPAWALIIELDAKSELPEAQMAYETADLADEAAQQGLILAESIAGKPVRSLIEGETGGLADYRNHERGGHRSVFFLNTLDKLATFADLANEIAAATPFAGLIATYVQPRLQGRNCHIEFRFPVDPGNSGQTTDADALAKRIAEACAAQGGHFSRPYGCWNRLAQQSSPTILPYLEQTKTLFDPHGILNPGRFDASIAA